MAGLDVACQEVVGKIEAALACVVVDRATNLLLAAHRLARHRDVLDEVQSAAVAELFFAPGLARLGINEASLPSELSELHLAVGARDVFARAIGGGRALLLVATDGSANVGMVWAQLKWAVPNVEALLA